MLCRRVAEAMRRPRALEGGLTVVNLERADLATRYQVLPGVLSAVHWPPAVGDGSSMDGTRESLHRWWTHAFRVELYEALGPFVAPLDPGELRGRAWGPLEFCRAAGVGLVRFVREELGFGIDLIRAVEEGPWSSVAFLTDNRAGLRFAQVLSDVSRIVRVPSSMYYWVTPRGTRGGFPIPLPAVGGFARLEPTARQVDHLRARVGSARRRLRGIDQAIRTSSGPTVAFFEPNSRGWAYAIPVMRELLARGIDPVPLVVSPSDGELLRRSIGREPFLVLPLPLPRPMRAAIHQVIDSLPIDLGAGAKKASGPARELMRRTIKRRLQAYLPSMNAAIEAARFCAERWGVKAAYQFSHISPASRAFMIESQAYGVHTFTTPEGLPDPSAPEHRYAVRPDTLLAWGSTRTARYLGARHIRLVGNDVVEERLHAVESAIARSPGRRSTVVVAFGRPGRIAGPEFFASSIRLVAVAAARLPDVRFVANIHPGDSEASWLAALDLLGHSSRLELASGRIYELMGQAMALITTHSTTGGEAIWVGIPVICVGSHQDPITGEAMQTEVVADYLGEGAAYAVTDVHELCDVIDHIRSSPVGEDRLARQRRAYADRFLFRSSEGNSAAARIGDAIQDRLYE
jgi:hypothetical protein